MSSDAHCHFPPEIHKISLDHLMEAVIHEGRGPIVFNANHLAELSAFFESKASSPQNLFISFGVPPWQVINEEASRNGFEDVVQNAHRLHFLGETGLDYAKAKDEKVRALQMELFEKHLHLAMAHCLPVVIHEVRAQHDVLRALKRTKFMNGGIYHGFRGRRDFGSKLLDLGFCLAIGPHLVRYSAPEAYRWLPQSQIVVESDLPLSRDNREAFEAVDRSIDFLRSVWGLERPIVEEITRNNLLKCCVSKKS